MIMIITLYVPAGICLDSRMPDGFNSNPPPPPPRLSLSDYQAEYCTVNGRAAVVSYIDLTIP